MAKLEKFMFDTEFEMDDKDWNKEEVQEDVDPDTLPRYSEHDMRAALEKARQEADAEGHSRGLAEAHASIEAFAAQELVKVAAGIERVALAEEGNIDEARREAAGLALAIARRIAGALIDRDPGAFVEQMIAETLGHMTEALRESRIVIRVAPELSETLSEQIASITARVAFTGQAMVIGDDTLLAGDCRVEWAQGGAELIREETERWVSDAVERYLKAVERPPAHEEEETLDEAPGDESAGSVAEPASDTKSAGGSKSARYDAAAAEARPEDEGVKSVGGSKSVRYE